MSKFKKTSSIADLETVKRCLVGAFDSVEHMENKIQRISETGIMSARELDRILKAARKLKVLIDSAHEEALDLQGRLYR